VSRDIEFDIRNDLLDRLLILEPEFYVRNRTGELMSRATNDLKCRAHGSGSGNHVQRHHASHDVDGHRVDVQALAFADHVGFVARARCRPRRPPLWKSDTRTLRKDSGLARGPFRKKCKENLSGVRVIRAYAQEDAQIRAFDEPNREYVARNVKLIRTWSMFMPSLQALIGTTFLIVLWKGGYLFLRNQLSLGGLVSFSNFLTLLVWPMIALGWVTNIFQRGAAPSMGRLTYILNAQPRIDDRDATVPANREVRGEIEFRDLSFTYPTLLSGDGNVGSASANGTPAKAASNGTEASANASHPTLSHINLRIPAGSTVAIIGPTGCGKTTLAALVSRLWDAPAGEFTD